MSEENTHNHIKINLNLVFIIIKSCMRETNVGTTPITRKYPERISITLISIKTIVLIMPTTITINERTKER